MGLNSRNLDRSRRRALKRLCRGDIGAGHLLIPVPDPEQLDKEAKLARAQKKKRLNTLRLRRLISFLLTILILVLENDDSITFFLGN
jgi:hypothetical protein